MADRLFLDANILFSAAYRQEAGISRLWHLEGVELVTSAYAREEAYRNLSGRDQQERLRQLLEKVAIIAVQPLKEKLPVEILLPEKDKPIVLAAIHARASHLITGDFQHFGKYYGKTIEGVLILPPATYLANGT